MNDEHDDDIYAPQHILPNLRMAVSHGLTHMANDLKLGLAEWLCEKHLATGDDLPSSEAIQAALQSEQLENDLTEDDVTWAWYYGMVSHTPAYYVVEALPTHIQPDAILIKLTLKTIRARGRLFIKEHLRDPKQKQDVIDQRRMLKDLRKVTVKQVLEIWDICHTLFMPPFVRLERKQMN